MIDTKKVKKQLEFCEELMERLARDIKDDTTAESYYGVELYTRKKGDIIRLRRELNELNKLLYPYH